MISTRVVQSARRRFWNILKILDISFIENYEGARLRFLPNERLSELVYCQFHEQKELRVFGRILKEEDIVIDVGANMGIYSCVASRKCGEKGLVLAIEPNRNVLPRLVDNLFLNDANNTSILSVAVGKGSGMGEMYCPPSDYSAFGSMVEESGSEAWPKRVIPVVTLDYIWEHFLNKRAVSYLKIDVEGFEHDVISGANNMLSSTDNEKPVIQFEVNSRAYSKYGTTRHDVTKILRDHGYDIFILDNGHLCHISKEQDLDMRTESVNLFGVPSGKIEELGKSFK